MYRGEYRYLLGRQSIPEGDADGQINAVKKALLKQLGRDESAEKTTGDTQAKSLIAEKMQCVAIDELKYSMVRYTQKLRRRTFTGTFTGTLADGWTPPATSQLCFSATSAGTRRCGGFHEGTSQEPARNTTVRWISSGTSQELSQESVGPET